MKKQILFTRRSFFTRQSFSGGGSRGGPKIISLIFGVLVICFLVAFYALGWTEPTAVPPSGNVPAPINVGTAAQNKLGNFGIGGGAGQATYWLSNIGGTLFFKSTNPATADRMVIGQDGNVGIGTTGPSQKFQVNDTATAAFVVTSAGQVGIGTTGPGYRLEILGTSNAGEDAVIRGTGSDIGLALDNTGTGGRKWRLLSSNNASGNDGGKFIIWDANAGWPAGNRFVIDNSGNVGIGTTGPGYKLDVENGSIRTNSNRPTIILSRDGTNRWDIGVTGAAEGYGDSLFFGDAVSNYIMVMQRDTGNVGIGTKTPTKKLDVAGDANATRLCIVGDCRDNWGSVTGVQGGGTVNYLSKFTASGTIGNSQIFDNGTNVGIGTTGPSQKFQVNDTATAAFVVTSAGQVGIGTTGPGERLDLGGGNIAMGYEVRTQDCDVIVSNVQQVCSVSCSAGKYVLGGGCWILDLVGNTAGTLQNSAPAGNGWSCSYSAITKDPGTVRAEAICANIR